MWQRVMEDVVWICASGPEAKHNHAQDRYIAPCAMLARLGSGSHPEKLLCSSFFSFALYSYRPAHSFELVRDVEKGKLGNVFFHSSPSKAQNAGRRTNRRTNPGRSAAQRRGSGFGISNTITADSRLRTPMSGHCPDSPADMRSPKTTFGKDTQKAAF
jgi:hypothetical protein